MDFVSITSTAWFFALNRSSAVSKKHKSTLNYPALVLKARTAAVRSRFDSGSPLFSFDGGCPLMLDK